MRASGPFTVRRGFTVKAPSPIIAPKKNTHWKPLVPQRATITIRITIKKDLSWQPDSVQMKESTMEMQPEGPTRTQDVRYSSKDKQHQRDIKTTANGFRVRGEGKKLADRRQNNKEKPSRARCTSATGSLWLECSIISAKIAPPTPSLHADMKCSAEMLLSSMPDYLAL